MRGPSSHLTWNDPTLFCTLSKLVNAQNANPDITINIELAKINEWLEINKLSINFFFKIEVYDFSYSLQKC